MSSLYTKQNYIDYVKRQVSGGLLNLEIEDEVIGNFIEDALVELRRYYDVPLFVTVPYANVIDLTNFDHSAITNVYRANSLLGPDNPSGFANQTAAADPMYVQQWAAFSGAGMMYNLQNYVMNYLSYSTLHQMQNTTGTDMNFLEDKKANKLYINCNSNIPAKVTIEYIPVLRSVEEITDDYWIDILRRLSVALVKIALGRLRTRFTQSNALWTQDGETLLAEGNETLKDLRETLRVNDNLFIPLD